MYPKASANVDKMGYKGHGLGPQEQGRKAPISPISYKHNRGLGYSAVPKVTITIAPIDPPSEIEDSDEQDFYEVPFEYLDDLFDDAYVNTITPITPSTLSELTLVHPELIDWDQRGTPTLHIYVDDNSLLALLSMRDFEDHTSINGIQHNKDAYFGSQISSLTHKNENKKKNHNSPSENLSKALSNLEKVKIKNVSSSENLDQVLEDEGLDLPTMVPSY